MNNLSMIYSFLTLLSAICLYGSDENYASVFFKAMGGDIECLHALLNKQGPFAHKWDEDRIARNIIMMGCTASIEFFLKKGIDLNKEIKFELPLCLAATYRNRDVIDLLLINGASVNQKAKVCGETALMCAAWRGNTSNVEFFLEKGAAINAVDNLGRTALMRAAEYGRTEVVELLLTKGAIHGDIKDQFGETDFSYALKNGHQEIVDLLSLSNASFYWSRELSSLNNMSVSRLLKIINEMKRVHALSWLIRKKIVPRLKEHESHTNSIEYRNMARIFYTIARRIAEHYLLSFGRRDVRNEVLDRDTLEIITVATLDPQLNHLSIVTKDGKEELFTAIVDDYICQLCPIKRAQKRVHTEQSEKIEFDGI